MFWNTGKFFMALAIAILVGILLTALIGPALDTIKVPIADVVAKLCTNWGFPLGLVFGVLFYFGYNRGTV